MKRLTLNYVLITALICSAVFTSCNVINVKQVLKEISVAQISKYGENSGSRNTGGLTITDIPAKFNGKYASFGLFYMGNEGVVRIVGRQTLTKDKYGYYEIKYSRISNGKVTIPVWTGTYMEGFVRYYGDGTFDVRSVDIYSVGTPREYERNPNTKFGMGSFNSPVKFSKGNATLSWNDIDWTDNPDN